MKIKTNEEHLYESPVMEIMETLEQSVICGSQGQDLPEWGRKEQEW